MIQPKLLAELREAVREEIEASPEEERPEMPALDSWLNAVRWMANEGWQIESALLWIVAFLDGDDSFDLPVFS